MIPGSSGGAQKPLQVRLEALPAQPKASPDRLRLGWRQADKAFEVGSSSKGGREEGGPRIPACPLPLPTPYPIASPINLTLDPAVLGSLPTQWVLD